MQTYLFYDIETTGLNKAFDQVLQFAAIRTDLNLVELERHEFKVKLNRDVIPSPKAIITHHIGIQESLAGEPEIDVIKKIHRLLNTPGTISLGYNTLGFDDEFLRFSFHRNLLAPYTHQFANQCGRMDIYPMTILFYLFKNSVIQWPTKEEKISLKLENINAANQLATGRAHHAMVDVEVTLALAKLFFQEREMWNFVGDYFKKPIDEKRSQNIKNQIGLMIYGKLGADNFFQSPVLFLGNHRHYKNQGLWLRLDTDNLKNTQPDAIHDTTWVIRKKLAEPGFLLPFEEKYLKHLSQDRLSLVEENKKWLQQSPDIFQHIVNYHAEYKYPVYPETDVDADLYQNGFWSPDEERFCRQFHQAAPREKSQLTERLKNSRLKTLATRLLGRHYPDFLTDEQAEDFAEYIKNGERVDHRGEKSLTVEKVMREISELREQAELSQEQMTLLEEVENYLKKTL